MEVVRGMVQEEVVVVEGDKFSQFVILMNLQEPRKEYDDKRNSNHEKKDDTVDNNIRIHFIFYTQRI